MKQLIINLKENLKNLINRYNIVFASIGFLIVLVGFFFFQIEKPTSFHGMLRTGETYIKQGKLSFALEHYNKLVRNYPRSYEAHMRLGNLFLQVKEPEKAKIEFYRAVKLRSTKRYDAHFALANIYISEDNFKFAQEILAPISNIARPDVQEKMGDFYHSWADRLYGVDDFDAIRKYRESYNYYHRANSRKTKESKKQVEKTYAKVAEDLVAQNKVEDAIKMLELSLEFSENALAHYKLARIYEKLDENKAISEYETTFRLRDSKKFDRGGYVNLLIKKGDLFKSRNNVIEANNYYLKAKKLNAVINAPYLSDKHIILSIVSARYNEDTERDIVIPGINFKIMNVSKDKINYLKVRIVFSDNGEYHSEDQVIIAEPGRPMEADAVTEIVSVFSPRPVFQVFAEHNIKAQIYISQRDPEEWKLYRNFYFDIAKTSRPDLSEE